jgi:hypothetical protein
MRGISWLAENLLAFQEGLCSVKQLYVSGCPPVILFSVAIVANLLRRQMLNYPTL